MDEPIEESWSKMIDLGFIPWSLSGGTNYEKTIEVSPAKDPGRIRGVFRGTPTVRLTVEQMGGRYYARAAISESFMPFWSSAAGYEDPVVAVLQAQLEEWGL